MHTKILLIKDVDDLGRSGDVVSVKSGFARNFLLPQKMGVSADKNALRMQARLQEERKKKAVEDKKEAEVLAEKIEGQTLTTTVKVDQEGHMYGSVTVVDVVNLFAEQLGITLEKRWVGIKQPIKKTGDHSLNVKLKEGVMASFLLKIDAEVVRQQKGEQQPEGEEPPQSE